MKYLLVLALLLFSCAPGPIYLGLVQMALQGSSTHTKIKTQVDAERFCRLYALQVAYIEEDIDKIMAMHSEDYYRCIALPLIEQ
jgi:hypothetical protein